MRLTEDDRRQLKKIGAWTAVGLGALGMWIYHVRPQATPPGTVPASQLDALSAAHDCSEHWRHVDASIYTNPDGDVWIDQDYEDPAATGVIVRDGFDSGDRVVGLPMGSYHRRFAHEKDSPYPQDDRWWRVRVCYRTSDTYTDPTWREVSNWTTDQTR
jgi:hypothetical protein